MGILFLFFTFALSNKISADFSVQFCAPKLNYTKNFRSSKKLTYKKAFDKFSLHKNKQKPNRIKTAGLAFIGLIQISNNKKEKFRKKYLDECKNLEKIISDHVTPFGQISIDRNKIKLYLDPKLKALTREKLYYLAKELALHPNSTLEITVLEPEKETITKDDICKRIKKVMGNEDKFRQAVLRSVSPPPETYNTHHSATMGGLGVSISYQCHTEKFIFSLRGGMDKVWGQFIQTSKSGTDHSHDPAMGIGCNVGAGIAYKIGDLASAGFEFGGKLSQFTLSKIGKKHDRSSHWFWAPYGEINCTIYPSKRWAMGMFMGYVLPSKFKIERTDADIPIKTECKIDKLYGGIRVSAYLTG